MDKVKHGYTGPAHVHADATTRHLDAALLQLDLPAEIAALESSEVLRREGHTAKTLMKFPELRVVLLELQAGAQLGEHETKGRLTLQVLRGHVALRLEEREVELSAGALFAIAPQLRHDLAAREPSSVLLTIAWPSHEEPR